MWAVAALLRLLCLVGLASGARQRGGLGAARQKQLQEAWTKVLDGSKAKAVEKAADTPVTRAVTLLKEIQAQLEKEMQEDEDLYQKMVCWCRQNQEETEAAIDAAGFHVPEVQAFIESLKGKLGALKTNLKDIHGEITDDRRALDEATGVRKKQSERFTMTEAELIEAIENLRAAILVLSKHHGPSDSTVQGGPIFKSEKDSWESLLAVRSEVEPWSTQNQLEKMTLTLDDFMRSNGFDTTGVNVPVVPEHQSQGKFLQNENKEESGAVTAEEAAVVRKALKSASAFMQAHHGYTPAYNAQSGEILGILKQLKEDMEKDLAGLQKRDAARNAAFHELRDSKTAEIRNGQKMEERKEDTLADTFNNLAQAKEDLGEEMDKLAADQKFLVNIKKMCDEAYKNFQLRKASRLEEIKAVSETIEILTADDARDVMSSTYNFLQAKSAASHEAKSRKKAATLLRQKAAALKDPMLSVLATGVELDAFAKVKQAIDKMIATLNTQQADEVKKNDFCKDELQKNEMATAEGQDRKEGLEAKANQLASTIQSLTEDIATAKKSIASLQVELQRASEDRKSEHEDFQKTVADQRATQEVLKTALDRLAKFYDKEAFLQKLSLDPPPPQMEYKPSQGAEGVMQLLEKLIQEANQMTVDATKSESEAQAAYQQVVADTNASAGLLLREISSKTKAKVAAEKEKAQALSDISDTQAELEGLAKVNAELHSDCDYLLKNFAARQGARSQEIEALQQAKQILNGASQSR